MYWRAWETNHEAGVQNGYLIIWSHDQIMKWSYCWFSIFGATVLGLASGCVKWLARLALMSLISRMTCTSCNKHNDWMFPLVCNTFYSSGTLEPQRSKWVPSHSPPTASGVVTSMEWPFHSICDVLYFHLRRSMGSLKNLLRAVSWGGKGRGCGWCGTRRGRGSRRNQYLNWVQWIRFCPHVFN